LIDERLLSDAVDAAVDAGAQRHGAAADRIFHRLGKAGERGIAHARRVAAGAGDCRLAQHELEAARPARPGEAQRVAALQQAPANLIGAGGGHIFAADRNADQGAIAAGHAQQSVGADAAEAGDGGGSALDGGDEGEFGCGVGFLRWAR
jgi:hypothetical protein